MTLADKLMNSENSQIVIKSHYYFQDWFLSSPGILDLNSLFNRKSY